MPRSDDLRSTSGGGGERHPATTSRRPPRAEGFSPTERNKTSKLVKPNDADNTGGIPIVRGKLFNKVRSDLIDTGPSNDVLPAAHAYRSFPECIRTLINEYKVNTANGPTWVNDGVRIKLGNWDCATDAMIL